MFTGRKEITPDERNPGVLVLEGPDYFVYPDLFSGLRSSLPSVCELLCDYRDPGRISFPEPEQSAGFCRTKQGLVKTSAFNDLYRTGTWVNWSRTFNVQLMKIKIRPNVSPRTEPSYSIQLSSNSSSKLL